MLSPSWSRSIGWEHIQLLFFFSQKPQVYGGYISGNGTDFLFICSILTCVVHLHFLCGWVAPGWYSLGCVEISDPPGSWCELKVWISVGILLTHHPGMSPGDGWDGQANLAPISSVFCMLHTLQALVSLLLTILPLLSLSGPCHPSVWREKGCCNTWRNTAFKPHRKTFTCEFKLGVFA